MYTGTPQFPEAPSPGLNPNPGLDKAFTKMSKLDVTLSAMLTLTAIQGVHVPN